MTHYRLDSITVVLALLVTAACTESIPSEADAEGRPDQSGEYTATLFFNQIGICEELTDLNPAFFDRNASLLSDEARAAVQDNVDILNTCPNICVNIEGYTARGERDWQNLSTARANAVQKFYTDNGVSASRLTATGKGRLKVRGQPPLATGRADSIPALCGS